MDIPMDVLIHNEALGMKGGKGTLLQVSPQGFYEINCPFGDKLHRVLFPVATTVLICQDPEEPPVEAAEVER